MSSPSTGRGAAGSGSLEQVRQDASVLPSAKVFLGFLQAVSKFAGTKMPSGVSSFSASYTEPSRLLWLPILEICLVDMRKEDGGWTVATFKYRCLQNNRSFIKLPYREDPKIFPLEAKTGISKRYRLSWKQLNMSRTYLSEIQAWGITFQVLLEFSVEHHETNVYVSPRHPPNSPASPWFTLHLSLSGESTGSPPWFSQYSKKNFCFDHKWVGGPLINSLKEKRHLVGLDKIFLNVNLKIDSLPSLRSAHKAAVENARKFSKAEAQKKKQLQTEMERKTSLFLSQSTGDLQNDGEERSALEAELEKYREAKSASDQAKREADLFIGDSETPYAWKGLVEETTVKVRFKSEKDESYLDLAVLSKNPLFRKISVARKSIVRRGSVFPPFAFQEGPPPPPGAESLDPAEQKTTSASSSSSSPALRGEPSKKKRRTGPPSTEPPIIMEWPGKSSNHVNGSLPQAVRSITQCILPTGQDFLRLQQALVLPPGGYLLEEGLALAVGKGNDPFTNQPHAAVSEFKAEVCVHERSSESLEERRQAIERLHLRIEERQKEVGSLKGELLSSSSSPGVDSNTRLTYAINHTREMEKDQQQMRELLAPAQTKVDETRQKTELSVEYRLRPVRGFYKPGIAEGK